MTYFLRAAAYTLFTIFSFFSFVCATNNAGRTMLCELNLNLQRWQRVVSEIKNVCLCLKIYSLPKIKLCKTELWTVARVKEERNKSDTSIFNHRFSFSTSFRMDRKWDNDWPYFQLNNIKTFTFLHAFLTAHKRSDFCQKTERTGMKFLRSNRFFIIAKRQSKNLLRKYLHCCVTASRYQNEKFVGQKIFGSA